MFRFAQKAFYAGCGYAIGIQTSVYFNDFKSSFYKQEPLNRNFIAEAAEKVLPSVVNIKVESEDKLTTSGSGMFIENDLILTNGISFFNELMSWDSVILVQLRVSTGLK